MSQYEVATLKKGLLILDALRQTEELTLSDMIDQLDLNKSTAFRLVYTLEAMGYVKKEGKAYRASHKLSIYSAPESVKVNWLTAAPLYQLSAELGETVYVGTLIGTDIVTTQVVDGNHAIRSHSEIGDRAPAHLSALGKAILAFLNDHERESLFRQLTLVRKTEKTFADFHLLRAHLTVIHDQGYSVDDEETEVGLRCVAAPIFYHDRVIAAVALSGPASRLIKKKDRLLSKKLMACSKQISKLLD
ncbi:MAG: IclR family transcriptional regulator [Sporolactobacillus sp.]|uniref:IclR family transcriptional regulator n=1 Tax=Sporolactobacillus sp. STSJ-5 TaxID=2965076 RepID=UPI002105D5D0|nr:IclR family transcriptional regulator [Sporolactobacillus sp. STSJ-5]MCQ2009625.1 IclR family transcriptional regulator [Sporolactobacillus sp. STSJ-5]